MMPYTEIQQSHLNAAKLLVRLRYGQEVEARDAVDDAQDRVNNAPYSVTADATEGLRLAMEVYELRRAETEAAFTALIGLAVQFTARAA